MRKYIFIYGIICGLIGVGSILVALLLSKGEDGAMASTVVGYLIMFLALSMIFLGIKKYRDQEQGGVIRFSRAFLMGLGMVAVAGVLYVIFWEIYLRMTDYAFISDYTAKLIETKKAAGLAGAELAAFETKMADMATKYENPLFRVPITFIEIFPVGALMSLVSAFFLRNPKKRQSTG